jgi:acetylglutamate/LysW-gamma-L-alpha-aminoadipate kinase
MLVVKVGGSQGIDYGALCDDVAALWRADQPLLLVHGGSHETNLLSEQLGHPPRFVTSPSGHSSRFTDRQTLEMFAMVYAGKMNTLIVERLQMRAVNAVGLSGLDGRLLEGKRKDTLRVVEGGRQRILRGDWTGTVERVNVALLQLLLGAGYLPVVSPPAASEAGEAVNVDGDRAAAQIAAALRAETLLLLSNVPGLLRHFPDESTLVRQIAPGEIDEYAGFAEGRMKKKVLGAKEALAAGVGRVIIGDARVPQPIRQALGGAGTRIG